MSWSGADAKSNSSLNYPTTYSENELHLEANERGLLSLFFRIPTVLCTRQGQLLSAAHFDIYLGLKWRVKEEVVMSSFLSPVGDVCVFILASRIKVRGQMVTSSVFGGIRVHRGNHPPLLCVIVELSCHASWTTVSAEMHLFATTAGKIHKKMLRTWQTIFR